MVRVYSIPNYVNFNNLLGQENDNRKNNPFGKTPKINKAVGVIKEGLSSNKVTGNVKNTTDNLKNGNDDELLDVITNAVIKERENNVEQHKYSTKFGYFLYRNQGELEAQLINAIFTTTLAPFFIAYNPLSNKDEKTKKYTALRQPISAGVAIAGGVALTKPLNHYLEHLAENGFLGNEMDKSLIPAQKNYTEIAIKEFAQQKKEAQDFYKLLIGERPENISVVEKENGKFVVRIKTADKAIDREVKSITRFKTKEEVSKALNKYLNGNNLHYKKMGTLLSEFFNIPYDTEMLKDTGNYVIENNKFLNKCKKIKAMFFLNNIGLIDKNMTPNRLVALISELGDKLERNGVETTLSLPDRKSFSRQLSIRLGDEVENVNLYHLLRYTSLLPKIDGDKEWNNTEINKLLNMNVIEAAEKISKKMQLSNSEHLSGLVKDLKTKKGVEAFLSQIAENNLKRIGSRFSHFKKYIGIITNLFQVMFTCTLLNYLYPRIVHKFWPHLEKEDDKLSTVTLDKFAKAQPSFQGRVQ